MAKNPEYQLLDVNRNQDQALRVRIRIYGYIVAFYWEKKLRWSICPNNNQVAYFPGNDICDTALFKQACKQASAIFASSRRKMQEKNKKEGMSQQLVLPF